MEHNKKRMPDERDAVTHRFVIGGEERNKGYVTVGLYEDGTPGELFVKMDRQGSQVSGFVDAWAIAVSMLLQSGTPLEVICTKFRGSRFKPEGLTDNPNIRITTSPIDYIVRWIEGRFLAPEPVVAPEPAVAPEPLTLPEPEWTPAIAAPVTEAAPEPDVVVTEHRHSEPGPEPEPTPEKKCAKCGSTDDVHTHYGRMQCAKCRSGKV